MVSFHCRLVVQAQGYLESVKLFDKGNSEKAKVLIRAQKRKADFLSWQDLLAAIFNERNLSPELWQLVSLDRFQLKKKHGCKCFQR